MKRHVSSAVIGLLALVMFTLVAPHEGRHHADAQLSAASTVAAAFVSIPTPLTTAIAAAQSAYELATWGQEGNKVDVKFLIGRKDSGSISG